MYKFLIEIKKIAGTPKIGMKPATFGTSFSPQSYVCKKCDSGSIGILFFWKVPNFQKNAWRKRSRSSALFPPYRVIAPNTTYPCFK